MKLARRIAFLILVGVLCANGAALLLDNGPLITHSGGGAGGADASALQTALGMGTYGWGFQSPNGFRVADDFVVPSGGWTIESMTFFGYQTDSTTTSTFTAMTLQIWDGVPGAPGSSVVFGDAATNRMTGSTWSGIYRVLDTGLTATERPIMANALAVGATLAAGTYWVDVDAAGSLGSGPWAPPITILGQTTTGNGMHFTGAWADILEGGTSTPQGLPFQIWGPDTGIPEPSTLVLASAGLLALGLLRRRR